MCLVFGFFFFNQLYVPGFLIDYEFNEILNMYSSLYLHESHGFSLV